MEKAKEALETLRMKLMKLPTGYTYIQENYEESVVVSRYDVEQLIDFMIEEC